MILYDMNPLISIIVPVYNGAAYLSQCVESIRSQTLKDWELILVDDGSTDDTPAICDDYAAIDQRVRVVHINNSGPSAAKNIGISLATGSYITFVDGDDEYGTNTTMEDNMAILMADSSIDVLQFPYVSISLKGRERLRAAGYTGLIEGRPEVLAMIGNTRGVGNDW